MPPPAGKAVFLSYASEDADTAQSVCDALRAEGVDVWFDRSGGLEHGDEWDAKIRRMISDCALFIPIISAATEARPEGYFRLEWELAADRALRIASGVPFILPVVIDGTPDSVALVPAPFRKVQWTRLPPGHVPPEFRRRILRTWNDRSGTPWPGTAPAVEPRRRTTPPLEARRSLAAVVFTDVVGYSTRMQRDETGTLALVQADFARMSERCAEHGGEVLNSMGDGLLMCFPSAVQAVTCALGIQSEFTRRRSSPTTEPPLEHRMGIHIGDVLRQESGGLAGDGVNIAARLEGKSAPGGVCVSGMVHETVRNKVPMQAVFGGPERFKNIAEPIPIWHLAPVDGIPSTPPASPAPTAAPRRRVAALALAALVGAAAIVLAFLAPRAGPSARPAPESPVTGAQTSPPAVSPAATTGNSLVVLPLENLSPDPENAFFTEGMHAQIIATLQRTTDLRVFGRDTALAFKRGGSTVADFAQRLGAANVITGSVRRSGSRVRILLELRRAADDSLLWSSPDTDRELTDTWAVQAEVAEQIARTLKARESAGANAHARLLTRNIRAFDLFLKGEQSFFAGAFRDSIRFYTEAFELDAGFVVPPYMLVHVHCNLFYYESEPAERVNLAKDARRWLDTVTRLDPGGFGAIAGSHYASDIEQDGPQGLELAERGLRALPNEAAAFTFHGLALENLGRIAEALESSRRASQLDPLVVFSVRNEALRLVLLRRVPEALATLDRVNTLIGTNRAGDLTNDVIALQYFLLNGTLPRNIETIAKPEERASWLWRARRFDELERTAAEGAAAAGPREALRFALLEMRHDALLRLDRAAEAAAIATELPAIAARLGAADEPGPPRREGWLARALARAGRADEAIAAARRYVESASPTRQRMLRWQREFVQAGILAYLRRPRECVILLNQLLRVPSGLTVPMLKVDPTWDPVRDDPGFKAMLADPRNASPL